MVEHDQLPRFRRLVREIECWPAVTYHPVISVEPGLIQKSCVGKEVCAEITDPKISDVVHSLDRSWALGQGLVERVVEQVDQSSISNQQIGLGTFHRIGHFIALARVRMRAVNCCLVAFITRERVEAVDGDAAVEK